MVYIVFQVQLGLKYSEQAARSGRQSPLGKLTLAVCVLESALAIKDISDSAAGTPISLSK